MPNAHPGAQGPFHQNMPFGAAANVKRAVWRECACVQCRRLLAADAAGTIDAEHGAAAGQEEDLTAAVATMLDERLPTGARFTHVASGGHRSKAAAGKLKKQGVRPGAPDFLILTPDAHLGQGAVILVELKTLAGTLSADQRGWRDAAVQVRGCFHVVARSVRDVEAALESAGVELKPIQARSRAA
jgi:rhodanese-related sulfurtransferase